MLGDIISLINFIKDMEKEPIENDNIMIKNFVDPVFCLLKEVNDNYLKTFRSYQDRIESSNPLELDLIIREIEKDRLFSRHLIDELQTSLSIDNDIANDFIRKIYEYINSPNRILSEAMYPWSNIRRNSLIKLLQGINELTPNIIINSGLLNEIENQDTNIVQAKVNDPLEYLIYSLEITMRCSYPPETDMSVNDRNQATNISYKLNDIKKYLAIQCINFIVKKTQENYALVATSYWQLKIRVT